jgi:hypothetical protein
MGLPDTQQQAALIIAGTLELIANREDGTEFPDAALEGVIGRTEAAWLASYALEHIRQLESAELGVEAYWGSDLPCLITVCDEVADAIVRLQPWQPADLAVAWALKRAADDTFDGYRPSIVRWIEAVVDANANKENA